MGKLSWLEHCLLLSLMLLAACAAPTADEARLASVTAEIEVYRSPT